MITSKMISDGIGRRDVLFEIDPNMGTGTVCRIGDSWFYFGGQSAEGQNPDEYIKNTPTADVVREITDVLEDFRKDEAYTNEYAYYEMFLREADARSQRKRRERRL